MFNTIFVPLKVSKKDAASALVVVDKLAMGDHLSTRSIERALPALEQWCSEWLEPVDDPKEVVMRSMARFGMNLTISKLRDLLKVRSTSP